MEAPSLPAGTRILGPTAVFHVPSETCCSKKSQNVWKLVYSQSCPGKSRETARDKVFRFLYDPQSCGSFSYHISQIVFLFAFFLVSALNTVKEYYFRTHHVVRYMETIIIIHRLLENMVLFWCSGAIPKFRGVYGKLRYFVEPIVVLDIMTAFAPIVHLVLEIFVFPMPYSPIRVIFMLQILRIFHLTRQGQKAWKLLCYAISSHKKELLTAMYFAFITLVVASNVLYMLEGEQYGPNSTATKESVNFHNYFEALWWAWITLTTIGYGDKIPRTPAGKLATCFITFAALCFFCLPASIIGAGMAFKIQSQQKQKKFARTNSAAATLVKRAFSHYLHKNRFHNNYLWRTYLNRCELIPEMSKNKGNTLFQMFQRQQDEVTVPCSHATLSGARSSVRDYTHLDSSRNKISDYQPTSFKEVTPQMKIAVLFIKKVELFVALRKFKLSRMPNEVTDLVEKYAEGQGDIRARIRKMEKTIGRPCSHFTSSSSLYTTLAELDQKARRQEAKLDLILQLLSQKTFYPIEYSKIGNTTQEDNPTQNIQTTPILEKIQNKEQTSSVIPTEDGHSYDQTWTMRTSEERHPFGPQHIIEDVYLPRQIQTEGDVARIRVNDDSEETFLTKSNFYINEVNLDDEAELMITPEQLPSH